MKTPRATTSRWIFPNRNPTWFSQDNLPDGRIGGRVLRVDAETADRTALSGATVRLSARDHGRWGWNAVTSEEGGFEFLGVPEGDVDLSAEARVDDQILRSGRIQLRLSDGATVEDVEIHLEPQRPFNLLVRTRNGPLGNATVLLLDTESAAARVQWTLGNGSTQFWVPTNRPVQFVVLAAGLGTEGWRMSLPPEGDLEVALGATIPGS